MRDKIENVLIEKILNRQEKVDEKVLKELGKVLGDIGNLNPSSLRKIKQQLKYDNNLKKIVKILSDNSKIVQKDIYKMFDEKAKLDYEFAEEYYKAKDGKQIPYEKNLALKNKVAEIAGVTYNETFDMPTYQNIAYTTGITFLDIDSNVITKPIEIAYKQLVDDAIINVSMGKDSFYETLAKQLKTIGEHGVQKIEYESGYHRRIDSALRMNMKEGLTRLSMEQQKIMGRQFGADGVEISVHEHPAPDHAPLQGHIFASEEFKKLQKNESAKDIKGNVFKLKRIIGQWNCYHVTRALILAIDEPRYSDEKLEKIIEENNKGVEYENKHYTMYEATQVQRRLETEIRKARETQITQKAAYQELSDPKEALELEKELNKTKKRIDSLVTKYHDFSKKTGLPTKLERTRVLTKK